jgi:SAM-dependent methyltransferase
MKRHAPATSRNRDPILDVLGPLLPRGARVLEIASGSGEHAVFFAARLPEVLWQPSDLDPDALASIEAHRAEAALPNLLAARTVDASSGDLGEAAYDAVVCVNMIHISPWEACLGLLRGASRALAPGGVLYLYGPYRIAGVPFAPSNEAFDASLRARDPRWGVRDLDEVCRAASEVGLEREAVVAMPANNTSVVLRRR